MEVNQEKERLSKNTIEDMEKEHFQSISEPTISYGLSLPPNSFEPLKGDNYSKDWKFSLKFETGPQVCLPQ